MAMPPYITPIFESNYSSLVASEQSLARNIEGRRRPFDSRAHTIEKVPASKVPASNLDAFSKAERTILQGAAEIIGLSPENLLAAANSFRLTDEARCVDHEVSPDENRTKNQGRKDESLASLLPEAPYGLSLFNKSSLAKRRLAPRTGHNLGAARSSEPEMTGLNGVDENTDLSWINDMFNQEGSIHFDNFIVGSEADDVHQPRLVVDSGRRQDAFLEDGIEMNGPTDLFEETLSPTPAVSATATADLEGLLAVPDNAIQLLPPDSTSHHNKRASSLSNRGQKRALAEVTETSIMSIEQPKKAKQRGPFHSHAERKETGRTRTLGACIRCHMQRIRVSDITRPLKRELADVISVTPILSTHQAPVKLALRLIARTYTDFLAYVTRSEMWH